MTQALEAAIASAAKLPPDEQDALAALLVAEMESEERSVLPISRAAG
jgi:hypothetical protein